VLYNIKYFTIKILCNHGPKQARKTMPNGFAHREASLRRFELEARPGGRLTIETADLLDADLLN
jgi:hypothetical protein